MVHLSNGNMRHLLFFTAAFLFFTGAALPEQKIDFDKARRAMVDEQIHDRGITTPKVLNAMLKVKRDLFVDPEWSHAAYEDRPLPIGHDQTISQPYIVGIMTDLLNLNEQSVVLEVGTGSGYQS